MIVVDSANIDEEQTEDEIVSTGSIYRKELISPQDTGGYGVLLVTFLPGDRLKLHSHPSEQILYVTEGQGIVATKTQHREISPGAVVYIPAGEAHWHGATQSSAFAHICIQKPGIKLEQ